MTDDATKASTDALALCASTTESLRASLQRERRANEAILAERRRDVDALTLLSRQLRDAYAQDRRNGAELADAQVALKRATQAADAAVADAAAVHRELDVLRRGADGRVELLSLAAELREQRRVAVAAVERADRLDAELAAARDKSAAFFERLGQVRAEQNTDAVEKNRLIEQQRFKLERLTDRIKVLRVQIARTEAALRAAGVERQRIRTVAATPRGTTDAPKVTIRRAPTTVARVADGDVAKTAMAAPCVGGQCRFHHPHGHHHQTRASKSP